MVGDRNPEVCGGVLVRKGKYFWGVYSGIVHNNSMLIIHDSVRFLAMGV